MMGTPSGATPSRGMGKGFIFYNVIMTFHNLPEIFGYFEISTLKSRRHGRDARAHYAVHLRRVLRRAGDQAKGEI